MERDGSGRSVSVVAVACAAVFAFAAGCSGNSPGNSPGSGGGAGPAGSSVGGSIGGSAGSAGTGGVAGAPANGAAGAPASGAAGAPAGGAAGAGGQGQTSCPLPAGPADAWVEVQAPTDLSGFHVTDAFAVGTNDLLFAGSTVDPTGTTATARLVRWTRGCWTVELTFPASATVPRTPSVHGTGPDDIWATAGDLIYHRDAQGWTPFTDDSWRSMVIQTSSFFGDFELRRVRPAAANDVWILAPSNILHWSGTAWTSYNFDDPGFPTAEAVSGFGFNDLWIDSSSSVWVVGPLKEIGNTMEAGEVHHFDGANWTHIGVGVGTIYAIWRAGDVLWLAEPTRALVDGQTVAPVLRAFDGANAPVALLAGLDPMQPMPLLTSLFGHGANDVWAGGTLVAHFDGQGWSVASDVPAAASDASDINHALVTGDPGSVWLATPGPRFFRKVTGP